MRTALYIVGGIIGIIGIAAIVMSIVYKQEIARYGYQTSLFTGAEQQHHFVRQERYFPVNEMPRSDEPFVFPEGPKLALPGTFAHDADSFEMEGFLESTDTAALLILKDGEILFEDYWLTGKMDRPWLTHSVSKSFISAAVGLAIRDGLIGSVEDPISQYVPAFEGSGYDGVAIRDVLQMSSGIKWDETYSDPNSDMNRLGKVMFYGSSYDDFVATMTNEKTPGTYNRYTGMDTQALTALVVEATDQSVADFLTEHLWHPLGAENDAFWTTDKSGRELGLGGFNATARDLAKLGELYRMNGNWNGTQILPEDWVRASTSPTAPHLVPGENEQSAHGFGYGYQWWLPKSGSRDFTAIGIYNQFVYVSPENSMVIVKLSSNRYYASEDSPRAYREPETISMFQAIMEQAAAAD
ncbi:MAG: serine hydrolase [Pseudomonadota bacterium]